MRPYVRAANVTWSGLDLSDVKEMNFDEADFARFRLLPGDVLINEGSGSAAEVGKPAIWRGEIAGCCFQNTLLRVQPRACSSEYAYNYIRSCAKGGQFVASTQGVNIFHIGREGLARHPIPLPPLPEQRRIVSKLDRLAAKSKRARDHLDSVLKLVLRYKESVQASIFEQVSTCQEMLLSQVCTSITDGDHQAPPKAESGVPFITISALNDGFIRLDKATRYVSISYYSNLKQTRIPTIGDVLFSVTGSIGLAAIVEGNEPFVFQRHIAILKANRSLIRSEFLLLILRSKFIKEQMLACATGTAQLTVPLSGLRNFSILLPNIQEQDFIIARVKKAFAWIDRLGAEATSARTLIDHLDQAVLSKAFRGELVPQDPNDEPASVLLERINAEKVGSPQPWRGRGRSRLATAT